MKIISRIYFITFIAVVTAMVGFGGYAAWADKEDHETLSPVSCDDHNSDVKKIASALRQGITKAQLFVHLGRGTGLEIARIQAIRALIEDAYDSPHSITRWYDNHIWVCLKS